MATARKTTKTVTYEVTTYTLELSEEERARLLEITGEYDAAPIDNDIYRALTRAVLEESPTSAPLAVGDRVRVTELAHEYTGRVGTLERIDLAEEVLPHMVRFDDGDSWWTNGVERA